ncbi:MAG TPA: FIST N-terminal domain-containing protein [Candidatus Limnocylindria bacterium]|nr:FIST N-terminal domain-containing protein [Candidatus Limnocylindria bacterium]
MSHDRAPASTISSTRPRVGAGLSTREDGREAARQAIDMALARLDGRPADLVFLFVSPQHEDAQRAIIDVASDRVEGATVLGCSAGGVIGGSREIEDAPAIAAWAASLPGIGVQPFRLTFQREDDHAVIEGLEELPPAEEEPVILMLADPFSFPADVLLDHLNESGVEIPIVGGMASGGLEAGRNSLYFNDEILRDGAVGAILTGGGMSAIVSQGCRPVGKTYAVTRAERNVLFELGGAPAMTRIEELYAEAGERDQLLIRRGLHVGSAITETKPELGRGDFLIRNVVGVDRDSGAIAISDLVEVGRTVQFQVRDAESAREDLRVVLERERTHRSTDVAGALLFSCNGRGSALFGQPDHDVNAVRRAFGDVPVAGFFAAGEIGPVAGKNFLHGFTASILLFRAE